MVHRHEVLFRKDSVQYGSPRLGFWKQIPSWSMAHMCARDQHCGEAGGGSRSGLRTEAGSTQVKGALVSRTLQN